MNYIIMQVLDSTRIWEGETDSDIIQNGFYQNVKWILSECKFWILSESEKAKRILIEYKMNYIKM